MPSFTNQATLSYNNITTSSNVVTGQLLEVLSATKTALTDTYSAQDVVTYVVSILNAGTTALNGLTVTDDLGAYSFGGQTLYPLDYIPGSVRLFINGVLQPAPSATPEPPLVISGINIPAGSNAVLVYEARVNQFAPLAEGSVINNTATVSGCGLSAPVSAEETISSASRPQLTISKSLCPATIAENGQLTYTFVIQNSGSQPATAEDSIIVRDLFDPILEGLTVTLDGDPLAEGVGYTYDQATGEFATIAGQITVPAADYVQDPATGLWVIQPGVAVLTVTGTV
ncbi:MAG: hypothetical protein J6D61_02715 [Clostridia bacterium]|nr:hypothetical protein [Clostridia bacterium]